MSDHPCAQVHQELQALLQEVLNVEEGVVTCPAALLQKTQTCLNYVQRDQFASVAFGQELAAEVRSLKKENLLSKREVEVLRMQVGEDGPRGEQRHQDTVPAADMRRAERASAQVQMRLREAASAMARLEWQLEERVHTTKLISKMDQ